MKTYRMEGNKAKYEPAGFSIILLSPNGKLIESYCGPDSFMPTL